MQKLIPNPLSLLRYVRRMRKNEEEQINSNQFLAQAIEREKMEGHRIAVIARTIALSIVILMLPFLNPNPNVLFYIFMVLLFIGIGWLQYKVSSVGHSNLELALIFFDLALLTLIFVIPNPFMSETLPNAMLYRFDNFIYYFILLAVGTLAYSWRTVWAIGTWVVILWLLGLLGVSVFGYKIPELSDAAAIAFEGHHIVGDMMDPNGLLPSVRFQEIVVFLIVSGILAIKGWRSNQLLLQQANIAAERANLSRYFPSSLVDVLASTDHDIGAVRSQDVAVLFTDIVGFTRYAETHSPNEVMELLRTYHAFIERAIFQNGGTLDKYLGDGVMATFGTPEAKPDDAANALLAAKQIIKETEDFNQQREKAGQDSVQVSIGVHFGPVILGDIGPSRRMEFAVVGDTVNVASRLEATTRELKCKCVVSDDLMKSAQLQSDETTAPEYKFTARDGIKLKGRESPINVWIA